MYGPQDQLLFDQVFDGAGNPTTQAEVDLRLPLGDHQNSTRLVLGHDVTDAVFIRQSTDYAPFGSVTAVRDAAGALTTAALDTAFAHHGSVYDRATKLQYKGARWYSPDLGRFVSVDPIEDGSNWYQFAGNDPVNFADPSGLTLAAHPLRGSSTLAGPQVGGSSVFAGLGLTNRGNSAPSLPLSVPTNRWYDVVEVSNRSGLTGFSPESIGAIQSFQKEHVNYGNQALWNAARPILAEATAGWQPQPYAVSSLERALAAGGDASRAAGEWLASGVEYVTSGYGGKLGNLLAGFGGAHAQTIRTGSNIIAGVIDVPRTYDAAIDDVRQTVRTGQRYGFRTGAARQIGLLQGAEAYFGTDAMTYEQVDAFSKTSEAFGRLGATAGTGAGIGKFFSLETPALGIRDRYLAFQSQADELMYQAYASRDLTPNGMFAQAPYRDVGGHHPLSGRAFNYEGYQDALSIGREEMAANGWGHPQPLTSYQRQGYEAFGRTGEPLTLFRMSAIEVDAMVKAGIPASVAKKVVSDAIWEKLGNGQFTPKHIPWVGPNPGATQ